MEMVEFCYTFTIHTVIVYFFFAILVFIKPIFTFVRCKRKHAVRRAIKQNAENKRQQKNNSSTAISYVKTTERERKRERV